MSLICVDVRSRQPISQQLIDSIRDLILKGRIRPDEQLPSVRALASELVINPNTIQKAYSELERTGVVYVIPGRGNFACSDVSILADDQKGKLRQELTAFLSRAKTAGMTREELLARINQEWGDLS